MILFGNLLIGVAAILEMVITFFIFLFIAHAVLSWVSPDPSNPIVQFINGASQPILSKVRQRVPPIGMFDLSVLIVILGLYFIDFVVVKSLMMYGNEMLRSGAAATVGFQ